MCCTTLIGEAHCRDPISEVHLTKKMSCIGVNQAFKLMELIVLEPTMIYTSRNSRHSKEKMGIPFYLELGSQLPKKIAS